MTKEQKLEMFSMRLDGATFQEIGDKFGLTRQRVEQILKFGEIRSHRSKVSEKCIYKGLSDYIDKEKITLSELAKMIGMKCKTTELAKKRITGVRPFKINEIRKILKITGMTFEECFSLKESEDEANE